MQAMGLVNDHVEGCFCRKECEKERKALKRPVPAKSSQRSSPATAGEGTTEGWWRGRPASARVRDPPPPPPFGHLTHGGEGIPAWHG